jgi:uncharacterized protein YkwD
MLFLVLMTFAFANVQSILLVSSNVFVSSVIPAALVDMTNVERARESLRPLTRSIALDTAARRKAEDMVREGYFAHDSPAGHTPWYWFSDVGYRYAYAGENLAVHFADSEEVVNAWMKSPGHRANIMNGQYTEIGIGTAKGTYKGTPTVFVVQMFGTPALETSQSQQRAPIPSALETAAQVNVVSIEGSVSGAQISKELKKDLRADKADVLQRARTVSIPKPFTKDSTTSTRSSSGVLSAHDEQGELKQPTPQIPLRVTADTPLTAPDTLFARESDSSVSSESILLAQAVPTMPLKKKQTSDISTTSGEPADVSPVAYSARPPTITIKMGELLYHLLASPRTVIAIVYLTLTVVVVIMLVCAVVMEVRKQHPLQVAYGVGLLAVTLIMFTLHMSLTAGALIV